MVIKEGRDCSHNTDSISSLIYHKILTVPGRWSCWVGKNVEITFFFSVIGSFEKKEWISLYLCVTVIFDCSRYLFIQSQTSGNTVVKLRMLFYCINREQYSKLLNLIVDKVSLYCMSTVFWGNEGQITLKMRQIPRKCTVDQFKANYFNKHYDSKW